MNGVRLWYRVAGRSGGIPLVFLHGGPGQGSQTFQAVGGPELEKTQRLVYLDQRGSGRSDRPQDPSYYSIDIMVEDVERLRRHLGVPKIALLGHSFGTQLALEYAARYPRQTHAVVLAAAAAHLTRSIDLQCERLAVEDPEAYARAAAGIRAGVVPRCNTMSAYTGDAATAFAHRNLFPDLATARRVTELDSAGGLGATGEAASLLFRKGYLQYRFSRAANVVAPVLIIAGGRDYQTAIEPQRDLVKELPRGRLLEYPEAGHFMFVETPERFARDVAAFLRRPPARARSAAPAQ
ncbi:MAG TPA: alpha/beta fold hydrolase [Allosphingosinicella sp.]